MKNICFLVGNICNSGGTERVVVTLVNGLCNKNYNVSILSLYGRNVPYFDVSSKVSLSSIYKTEISLKLHFLDCLKKIRDFCIKNNIEKIVLVDSMLALLVIPALVGLKIEKICWEHFNYLNNNGSKLRDIARKLAAYTCNKVVVLTNKDSFYWKKNIKGMKSELIVINNPNPFLQVNKAELEHKTVLAVGRLTKVKGFNLLLDIWYNIENKEGWKLLIIGDGEEKNNLQSLICNYNLEDSVELLGNIKEVEKFYASSSIYCLTSHFEGFPMVLLEAQCFGLPIIAYNCDTGPEDIVINNYNGFLINKGNKKKYIEKLKYMMNLDKDIYQYYKENSLINSEKFNYENFLNKWLVLLNEN